MALPVMENCQWKGPCPVPFSFFAVVMTVHWGAYGIIYLRKIKIAAWVLLTSSVLALVLVLPASYRMYIDDYYLFDVFLVMAIYMIIFGIVLPIYMFISKDLKLYEHYHKNI